MKAFNLLKEKLTASPMIMAPDWNLSFEIMSDAFDFALGAILGQKVDKRLHVIYSASRTWNDAQINYRTTKKELLASIYIGKIYAIIAWM